MGTAAPRTLLEALQRRFGAPLETHISWVFLDPREVFKIKKPVRFPYLDFSTLERRRAACEAEVKLNRRLAPDVYLDVVSVTVDAAGELILDADDAAAEPAVHMRRLPDAERADVLLARGALTVAQVEELAEHLARFHHDAQIDTDPNGPGGTHTLSSHVEENLEALGEPGRAVLGARRFEQLCTAQREAVLRTGPLRAARLAQGRIRDGHGDLRLDHVYFTPAGIAVLDCIEFDRAFRVADVCADVAFFAMNLHEQGRASWAERFVACYARDSADHDLYALLDFYLVYWALVRAKVSGARAEQVAGNERVQCCAKQRRLLELAAELATRPSQAQLVAVGGLIGAGKSHVARCAAAALSAPVLQSDRLRKQLAGVAPEAPLTHPEAYSAEATRRLYDELLRRAATVLESGRPVIIDASFRSRAERARCAELAVELGVPFVLLECQAPREALEARLSARAEGPNVSDARLDLLATFAASYEAPATDEQAYVRRVDTSGSKENTARSVEALLS